MLAVCVSAITIGRVAGQSVADVPIALDKDEMLLVELLRGAQTTNQARLAAGSLSGTITIRRDNGAQEGKLQAEVEWSGLDAFWKFRFDDPNGLFSWAASMPNSRKSNWNYACLIGENTHEYNPDTQTVYVRPARRRIRPDLLNLLPRSWFNCCPPDAAGGRPWTQLIGVHPLMPSHEFASLDLYHDPSDGTAIKQVRVDRDGGRSVATFSLEAAGNVIECIYEAADGRHSWRVAYQWGKDPNGVVIPISCHYGQMRARIKGRFTTEYMISIHDVKLGASSSSALLDRFHKQLPPGYKIDRDSQRPRSADAIDQETLDRLSETVRSRGFATGRP